MTAIDDYFKKLQPHKRKQLERIRSIAKKVVPSAEETISYRMPTLQFQGKSFLGFYAHEKHIGIYPFGGEEIEVFKNKLTDFELSKGTIRVPYDTPISESLLIEIIKHRINRIG